jgi:hypothetical protein
MLEQLGRGLRKSLVSALLALTGANSESGGRIWISEAGKQLRGNAFFGLQFVIAPTEGSVNIN